MCVIIKENIMKPLNIMTELWVLIHSQIHIGATKVFNLILWLGSALDELNKYQEAIQCYDKSINIKPTALRYYNKCTIKIMNFSAFPLEHLN